MICSPPAAFHEETNMYNYCKANLDGDRSLWGWNIEFNEGGSQTVLIGYQEAGNLVYDEFYGARRALACGSAHKRMRHSILSDFTPHPFVKGL